MIAKLRSLARNLRGRVAFEDEMDAEMRFHLESRAADLVRRGLSPAEAARQARIEFGSMEKQKDEARARAGLRILDEVTGDVRYALRTFVRNKGFAAAAIVTLALGIGANTAIFSLMDGLMLRRLPVHRPQDLWLLTFDEPASKGPLNQTFSYPLIGVLDAQKDVFAGIAGFSSNRGFTVGTGASMSRVSSVFVTGGFYETLGLTPALGRLLTRGDDVPGAPVVAVLSDGYWERAFARDPGVVGRTIVLNGAAAEIVGVSPRGFTGANVGATADVTIAVAALTAVNPQEAGLLGRGNFWLRALARLRPGISRDEAAARLSASWPAIAQPAINPQWPESRKREISEARVGFTPGATGWTYLRDMYARPLQVLMGIVALVLLIACANVASLMLARGTARRREIAVRLAIGAGRGRIVRQLLVESATLSLAGAGCGVLLASLAGSAMLNVMSTGRGALVLDLAPNWNILAFTAAVAIATAMLFGIAPALQSTAAEPGSVLREDRRTGTMRSRLLPSLVTAQMALSLILLIGSGLFIRTLSNLHRIDPGFRPEGVLIAGLEQRPGSVPASALDRVRALPGVVSASLSTHTPLSGATWSEPALPAGQSLPEHDTAVFVGASSGFFATLQIGIIAGREFSDADTRLSTPVAIVNEDYARRFLPNRNPIGQRLTAVVRNEKRELEIVGVARSIAHFSLRSAPPETVYVPYYQLTGDVPTNVEVRAIGSLAALTPVLQQALQPLLPTAPVEVHPLSSQVDATLVQERMMATLGTGFGALALALAAVGIYGLLAYGVARRTREIGIRMALGAKRTGVVALILRGARAPLVAGIAVGLPVAWALSRLFASMLFGLTPADPIAVGGATVLLVLVAHAAAYLPARRAARVDPLIALKCE
jgi:putative ABC transport system permease protein